MVNFNFSFDPGTSLQQMVGFETAGRIWSSYLTDNATVNIQVGVSSSLGSKVIGGALPGMRASQSYLDVRNQLSADAKSMDDTTALKGLSTSSDYRVSFDLFQNGTYQQQVQNTQTLNLTRADAKAMGFNLADGATALDGYILFGSLAGSSVQWDYNYTRSTAAPANSLDFLSTCLHEIGHVLGFVSGVDQPGWLNNTITQGQTSQAYVQSLQTIIKNSTSLDLFRYSTNSTARGVSDLSYGSNGGAKYFSIDQGITSIAKFSTGSDQSLGGSGEQASHWLTGSSGIMAPALSTGQRFSLAATDLKALDVIGWDVASSGINTVINLATLQSQAQQSLASRLGQTVSWLNANSTTAAQSLAQDRSQDVYTMAVNSQIYDLSRLSPVTPGTTAKLSYNQLFEERGLFETLDELKVISEVSIQPSLETLTWGAESILTRLSPPKPGAQPAVIITLPSLDITRLSPPTPGAPPTVIITLPSLDITRLSPPTPGAPPRLIVDLLPSSLSQSVQPLSNGAALTAVGNSLFAGKTNYFYGSSKPATYKGSEQSAQQPFAPLSVLVNLRVSL